jgi:UDP-N-acetylmuramyl pentapeptide phosphotransferase/UDP-N-acetylglucosamine-1-phosphate transferase
MANLFNFMDGADGLAGGMAAFGFSAMAIQANLSSSPMSHIGEFATVLAGASTGFLFFNFPPAKIFMGDSGSIPVGFAAAVLAIYGYAEDIWPLWFPALVFSPFIVDASVTLVIRLFNFKNLLQPHREHLYQRLILSGWSHRKTAFGYYFLMLASSLSALVAIKMKLAEQTLIFWGVTYVALVGIANWRLSRNK